MQRECDLCGKPYEAKRANSRFCEPKHRTAWAKGVRPAAQLPSTDASSTPPKPDVGAKLAAEFRTLGVEGTYEAGMALWLAGQLDTGTITGTAGVAMSRELDRRVDALRLRAELPNDPARDIRERLEDKHLRLVEGRR